MYINIYIGYMHIAGAKSKGRISVLMVFQESHLKILLNGISPMLPQFSSILSQKLLCAQVRYLDSSGYSSPIAQFNQKPRNAPLTWEPRYVCVCVFNMNKSKLVTFHQPCRLLLLRLGYKNSTFLRQCPR